LGGEAAQKYKNIPFPSFFTAWGGWVKYRLPMLGALKKGSFPGLG